MLHSKNAVLHSMLMDWRKRELITQDQLQALSEDADKRFPKSNLSFAAIIIGAGALCVFFAALSFVAANWDAIPRLTKLALLLSCMWAFWIGGIVTRLRGHPTLAEVLLFLGSAFYGLNIMLVAQIYHIQGNAVDAVWMWAIGATLASALAQSRFTLWGAISLWFVWLCMDDFQLWGSRQSDWFQTADYLIPFAILGAIAWVQKSRVGAHLLAISFLGWEFVTLLAVQNSDHALVPLYAVGHVALVPIFMLCMRRPQILRGFESALIFYALLASMIYALTLYLQTGQNGWHVNLHPFVPALILLPVAAGLIARKTREPAQYDIWISAAMFALGIMATRVIATDWIAAIYLLALPIWCTRMGWRFELTRLRALGMIAFVVAVLSIYGKTVGDTLLGTAGFFLGAGLLLLGSAYAAHLINKSAKGATA